MHRNPRTGRYICGRYICARAAVKSATLSFITSCCCRRLKRVEVFAHIATHLQKYHFLLSCRVLVHRNPHTSRYICALAAGKSATLSFIISYCYRHHKSKRKSRRDALFPLPPCGHCCSLFALMMQHIVVAEKPKLIG